MKPGVWAEGTEHRISPSSSRDLRIALHSRVVRIPPQSLINSFCMIRIFNLGGKLLRSEMVGNGYVNRRRISVDSVVHPRSDHSRKPTPAVPQGFSVALSEMVQLSHHN